MNLSAREDVRLEIKFVSCASNLHSLLSLIKKNGKIANR